MSDRVLGKVKWFDAAKGFGFIQLGQGEDVFVHFRAIRGDGYRTLADGQQVEFNITHGQKGLQAEDVTVLEE
jgi:cold shock protein